MVRYNDVIEKTIVAANFFGVVMSKILVCDDEKDIVKALDIYLSSDGYEVVTALNGQEALEILERESIDLVLLDVMMPVMDGIQTMARIREKWNVPVIFLTAKAEDTDKVLGLNVGADDYVTKPFNPVELLARVKSTLRRYLLLGGIPSSKETGADEMGQHMTYGGLTIYDEKKQATLDGQPLSLTPTEYDILKLLMQHPGQVFSPRQIYESVWQDTVMGTDSTVDVHIRHLREKIDIDPSNPRYLMMVWGRGYKLGE